MKQPREMSRDEAAEWSDSLAHPQLEPADHCYTVLQDFGAQAGGWAPVDVPLPWFRSPRPFVYTGDMEHVTAVLTEVCRQLAQATGRPTRLVRFTRREDIAVFGGSS